MVELAVYAFVAAFIFFRLYSSLGRASSASFGHGCVSTSVAEDVPSNNDLHTSQDVSLESVAETENLHELVAAIENIRSHNREFSLKHFMAGSASALELILKALNRGDTATLSQLLTDDMLEAFEREIERRKDSNRINDDVVVSILSQKIVDAEVVGSTSSITVRFLTEQINTVKDSEGNIIEGSVSEINTVEDRWTFSRDPSTPGRKWLLCRVHPQEA